MKLNILQYKILQLANEASPSFFGIVIEDNSIIGLSEYDINDVIISLKKLQNDYLIKNTAVIESVDNHISLGNIEITSLGSKIYQNM